MKYAQIITHIHGAIEAPQTRQENKRVGNINHVSTTRREYYKYNAQELLSNNTVKRLLNSPSVKDGYKIMTGNDETDIYRLRTFVRMYQDYTENEDTYGIPLIRVTETVLKEFARDVDGVELERVGRTAGEWCKNPAMRVKG